MAEGSSALRVVGWHRGPEDQFGVELGKKFALGIDMSGKAAPTGQGAEGLQALIAYVAKHR